MNGTSGIAVSISVFAFAFVVVWSRTRDLRPFIFDIKGEGGSFEEILKIYMRLAEVLITLAAGSIVLLLSSLAWHGTNAIPWKFAAPLFMLVFTIVYGFLFMAFFTMDYERFRHDEATYTRFKFTRNRALGFSALTCFCLGYFWLIAAAAT